MEDSEETPQIIVVPYREPWPRLFERERQELRERAGDLIVELEHIGSTAVPGLAAKPIIDMMAAVRTLDDEPTLRERLAPLGYVSAPIDMTGRFLFRRKAEEGIGAYHLHVVEVSTWPDRKERHLRDYLRSHPEWANQYATLKQRLATEFPDDPVGYTRAKTTFIQTVTDESRDAVGLPRVDVWEV